MGPTVNLRAAICDLEQGSIDSDLLKIRVELSKDAIDYAVNNLNKQIGMLLGARTGGIVWYFKTDKDVSISPQEISIL